MELRPATGELLDTVDRRIFNLAELHDGIDRLIEKLDVLASELRQAREALLAANNQAAADRIAVQFADLLTFRRRFSRPAEDC